MTMECTFWAVGQGLFSSGKIYDENSNAKPFTWVYDCGSLSNGRFLNAEINAMHQQYPDDIDLLVISHFDNDHINGLSALLANRKVKQVIMPYYLPWQRLVLATHRMVNIESETFAFYRDPVRYLAQQFEGKIEKILLLPVNNDEYLITFDDENTEEFYFVRQNELPEEYQRTENGVEVILLEPNKALIYRAVEFVPYLVPFKTKKSSAMTLLQLGQRIDHIWNNSALNIQTKVTNIKTLYSSVLTDLNKHSLYLYIRQLGKSQTIGTYSYANQQNFYFTDNRCNTHFANNDYKNAIFYSGDGELTSARDLNQLVQKMGKMRMSSIFCFQVLHHGAKNNWYRGLANDLQPNISVFSSASKSQYKHPSPQVVFGFMPYTPIWVNDNNHPDNRLTVRLR